MALLIRGLILPGISLGYVTIWIERIVEPDCLLSLPPPLQHAIEARTVAARLEKQIEKRSGERGRDENEIVHVAREQLQLKHEHVAQELPPRALVDGRFRRFTHERPHLPFTVLSPIPAGNPRPIWFLRFLL